jgi:hypothetical protein
MENTKKIELKEYHIGETTSIIIENVSKETLMTADEYIKFCNDNNEKGVYSQSFFAPEKAVIEHGIKLELFCIASENGERVLYYKSTK